MFLGVTFCRVSIDMVSNVVCKANTATYLGCGVKGVRESWPDDGSSRFGFCFLEFNRSVNQSINQSINMSLKSS
jgi:hypothetical protein